MRFLFFPALPKINTSKYNSAAKRINDETKNLKRVDVYRRLFTGMTNAATNLKIHLEDEEYDSVMEDVMESRALINSLKSFISNSIQLLESENNNEKNVAIAVANNISLTSISKQKDSLPDPIIKTKNKGESSASFVTLRDYLPKKENELAKQYVMVILEGKSSISTARVTILEKMISKLKHMETEYSFLNNKLTRMDEIFENNIVDEEIPTLNSYISKIG